MGYFSELSWLDGTGNPRELSHLSELGTAEVLQDYHANMTPAQTVVVDRYILSRPWASKKMVLTFLYTMNCGRTSKENT